MICVIAILGIGKMNPTKKLGKEEVNVGVDVNDFYPVCIKAIMDKVIIVEVG